MSVELRHLRVVSVLAEELHFGRAAARWRSRPPAKRSSRMPDARSSRSIVPKPPLVLPRTAITAVWTDSLPVTGQNFLALLKAEMQKGRASLRGPSRRA